MLLVYKVKYVYCLFEQANAKIQSRLTLIFHMLRILIGSGYSHDRLTSPPNPPLPNSPPYRPYTRGYSTLSRMYTTTLSLPLRLAIIRYMHIFIQCIYTPSLTHIRSQINTLWRHQHHLNLYLFYLLVLYRRVVCQTVGM